ncbi:MAG: Rieske 2Fe-2S domain-containing protein [Nitrospinae bacterium]|nr:Rieske 2Fe-2S domain-containing protein [Nitrospinota bacterium]
MDEMVNVGKCQNIPNGEGRKCTVKGEEIGIFNTGGEFFAVANRCPHEGGPLSDGILLGNEVVCPIHSRKIDLKTGRVAKEDLENKTFEVSVKNDEIFIHP